MKNYFMTRSKGIDEVIRKYPENVKKTSTSNRSKMRMNLPVFPCFNTPEEAYRFNNSSSGYIYAVRVSNVHTMMADLGFPVLYVKLPYDDFSVARKSYNEAIKAHYDDLRLLNRKLAHINNTNDYFQNHISPKVIGIVFQNDLLFV